MLQHGFMPSYNCWTKHRERGVTMEDNEEEDDDNYPEFPKYGDTFMGEAEGGAEMKGKLKERHMMSPLMISVGPLLMHGENVKLIMRGRSWIAC
jgi:hypothetical protein